jgi:predicted 3-demethylubiquinone-9 3-methyltransferase (glyoxalase superfamily)
MSRRPGQLRLRDDGAPWGVPVLQQESAVKSILASFAVVVSFLPLALQQQPAPSKSGATAMPPKAAPQQKITPFLWFDDDAEEAVRFYVSLFDGSKVLSETRWGEGGPVPKGTLMTANFTLAGVEYTALNGGPMHRLNEAFSLVIHCETQEEVDRYWEKLCADGGEPSQCGWLKDKFGLSWQVVPTRLFALLADPDPVKAGRVGAALMQMGKLDLAKLEAAHAGK